MQPLQVCTSALGSVQSQNCSSTARSKIFILTSVFKPIGKRDRQEHMEKQQVVEYLAMSTTTNLVTGGRPMDASYADPRISMADSCQTSAAQVASARTLIAYPQSRRTEEEPGRGEPLDRGLEQRRMLPNTQRNHGCPDVALFDDISGEFGERVRVNNVSSWASETDEVDYNKENQYVYRDNMNDSDHTPGVDLLCLYPSPAFSEEDAGNTYIHGIESY